MTIMSRDRDNLELKHNSIVVKHIFSNSNQFLKLIEIFCWIETQCSRDRCLLRNPFELFKGFFSTDPVRITIKVDQMSNLELRKGFVTGNFNLIDGTEPGDWDWDDS